MILFMQLWWGQRYWSRSNSWWFDKDPIIIVECYELDATSMKDIVIDEDQTIYDLVDKDPIVVMECRDDTTIEIHSVNDEELQRLLTIVIAL